MENAPNEFLIDSYLQACKLNLDHSFQKLLLDEIIKRDIYELLLETSF
ncbi:sporulation histidine kinase inhibitor Sda [Neobacillus cucumis]|uniref:Sporulation histidine kinase inhibitor Sda n=1 Tax=Neobacillus cucumis TaxID=1740721 RepID=A0A2N5HES0_9BACI|nr:sporulation histidine kinase inhibitor Sda [Neobacillus cucumis]PLS04031.1 sporulation histidine kinase inhibitor Sda [Neobacillus cucumis]